MNFEGDIPITIFKKTNFRQNYSNLVSTSIIPIILFFFLFCLSGACVKKEDKKDKSLKINIKREKAIPTPKKSLENMVLIPAGEYIIGSGLKNERNKERVKIDAFYIDKYPVTIKDYNKYLKSTGSTPADYLRDLKSIGSPDCPITGLTYKQAEAYARWRGMRLPTEEEYEASARGKDGFLYPWGNKWDKNNIDANCKKPHPVGKYPEAISSFGLHDTVGNVFHWTCTPITLNLSANIESGKVIKAGSWTYFPKKNKCTFRTMYSDINHSYWIGFRCVKPVDKKNDPNLMNTKKWNIPGPDAKYFDTTEGTRAMLTYQLYPKRVLPTDIEEHLSHLKGEKVVADVGCGIGFLTFKLSRQLKNRGKVYAVDIDKSVLDFINVVKQKENLKNIRTVLSKEDNISLPPDSCDEIYLLGTLHCLRRKEIVKPFIESCHMALKPGGLLIVIDSRGYDIKDRIDAILSMGFDAKEQHLNDDIPNAIYIKRGAR
ncbi:MAG: SUMF1/EgtB/PvdO family nonheme iron enzyme [Candidatus Eremiobacteraeota bacterium]|nr:SUMF1/EgtB/PvdO family nonheme iron enzyme [Candidatus Eremiobacteraeota bacterium]